MAGFSGYTLAAEIEDFIYRGVAITIGGTLYLRLLVSPSSRSGGGTETNYAGWARIPLVRNTTGFWTVAPSNGLLVNGVQIIAPVANSLGNGDLNSFDIVDTASGAFTKVYNGGPILPAVAMVVNKSPIFDVGKLQITF